MSESPGGEVWFRVEGEGAAAVARELTNLLREEFEVEACARELSGEATGGRKADPVAVAALIVSVPGAALATADLARRTQLAEKVRKLIAWARERKERKQGRVWTAALGEGVEPDWQDLGEVAPGQLLDAAEIAGGVAEKSPKQVPSPGLPVRFS